MARSESTLVAGISELLVLRLLSHREMYGYEIAKSVEASTGKELRLGEGLLYPLLHVLEARGLLRSRRVIVSGRPRVYYRLAPKGRRRLEGLTAKWRGVAKAINSILEGSGG